MGKEGTEWREGRNELTRCLEERDCGAVTTDSNTERESHPGYRGPVCGLLAQFNLCLGSVVKADQSGRKILLWW